MSEPTVQPTRRRRRRSKAVDIMEQYPAWFRDVLPAGEYTQPQRDELFRLASCMREGLLGASPSGKRELDTLVPILEGMHRDLQALREALFTASPAPPTPPPQGVRQVALARPEPRTLIDPKLLKRVQDELLTEYGPAISELLDEGITELLRRLSKGDPVPSDLKRWLVAFTTNARAPSLDIPPEDEEPEPITDEGDESDPDWDVE